jgi:hypothetical protein
LEAVAENVKSDPVGVYERLVEQRSNVLQGLEALRGETGAAIERERSRLWCMEIVAAAKLDLIYELFGDTLDEQLPHVPNADPDVQAMVASWRAFCEAQKTLSWTEMQLAAAKV